MVEFASPFFEGPWSTPTEQTTLSSAAEAVAAAAAAVLVQANAAASSASAASASSVAATASAVSAASYSTGNGAYKVYNVQAATYGAVADGKTITTTATMATGSRDLSIGASFFVAGDVGKLCMVARLDVAHALSYTSLTITAYYSPTSVQLSGSPYLTAPPYGPVSGESCIIAVGTNNSPAIQAAIDAALAAGGGDVFVPAGRYAIGQSLALGSNTRLLGGGYGSEIMACGVGWQNQPLTGDGPMVVNKDVRSNPQTAGNFDYSPNFRVDHDITVENIRFTTPGAVPQTQKIISFMMVNRVRILRCHFDCLNMSALTAFAGPGCSDVLVEENRGSNLGGGGAAAFDFWKGWRDVKIMRNIVSTRSAGAVQVINLNGIGTDYDDTEFGDDFQVIGNRIEMNGVSGSGELVAIFYDGLRAGSPTRRGIIAHNTIIGVSGTKNCGIIGRTEGGYVHIVNNTLVNLGGASVEQGVIRSHSVANPSGTSLTGPASVVNGTNVVTVAWTAHGINALDVTNGTWLVVPVDFGGITFTGIRNGFHKVLSVVDPNTFTFQAPTNATSTTAGLGTGTWTLAQGPAHGNTVSGNTIIDPIRTGFGVIDIGGYDHICTDNKVVVTSGSPAYAAVVTVWSHRLTGETAPAIIADNFGPTGSGAPSGYTGDGQVAWRTGSALPFIRNPDLSSGVWRYRSPVDFVTVTMAGLQAGSTYANDAAASAGGVAVGQLYRNGSVLMIRVT